MADRNFEKPKRTRKKAEVRRNEILNIAVDVFFKNGYHKASINDISTLMGTTKAAIYYHFRNKEEILFTIVDKITNELLLSFKACSSKNRDPLQRLHALIISQISLIDTKRKEIKILVEDKKFLSGELKQIVRDKEKTIFRLYRSSIQELKEMGKLRDIDLTTATFGIFGMINWLYHWYKPDGKLSIEELGEHIVKILLHGLLMDAAQ